MWSETPPEKEGFYWIMFRDALKPRPYAVEGQPTLGVVLAHRFLTVDVLCQKYGARWWGAELVPPEAPQ